MPWLFLRSRLAKHWGCRPRDIDRDDEDVDVELELMRLESAVAGEKPANEGEG